MAELARALARSAVILLFAGCSRASSDQKITLRFWGLGREGEIVAQLTPAFEREHPNIRVHVQQIPWTAAHEKLLTAQVGGSTPDVAQLGNTWIPEFASIHALQPLNAFYANSQIIQPGAYFSGIWDTNIVDDSVFGIPWYVDTRVIFYRKDILAQAGYDSIPQSWSEWLTAMRAIKKNVGPKRYAIYLPSNEWAQPVIFGLQNGSTLLRDHGRYGGFSEPQFREAFDFYLSLYREGLAPVQGLYDVADPWQEFERGYYAMWITGPWNMAEFKKRLPADKQNIWATSAMPGPTGAESGYSIAGGASLVMFRSSPHPREAWQLIEFLSRPDQQQRFYELTGSLPARREVWRTARLADDPYARAFWIQLQRTRPLPAVPEIESIVTRIFQRAEESIRGGATSQETLRNLDHDVDNMLEKRRWMLARGAQ